MRIKRNILEDMSTQKRMIVGLHRPFNKPLKSLCWVCLFAKEWKKYKKGNFYYNFYVHHIKNIVKHENKKNLWDEGCISVADAKYVLNIMSKCNLKERVSEILRKRSSTEDKLIYKTYKNTSYYISLAKKMALIDSEYEITKDGMELSLSNRNFYSLSKAEKKLIFRYLLEADADLILALIVTKSEVEKGIYPAHLALIYQKSIGNNLGKRYVRSFIDNYLSVMMAWISQLDVTKKNGGLKKEWEQFLQYHSDLYCKYQEQFISYQNFKNNILKKEVRKEKKYKKFMDSYDKLFKTGKTDLGYVNLYDIMYDLHMGYDRFSDFLNEFYFENRKNVIILLSNTVSSIDKRRRFQIGDKIVLKVKIIEKKKYEIGDTMGELNS
jgi:hypothetical protein